MPEHCTDAEVDVELPEDELSVGVLSHPPVVVAMRSTRNKEESTSARRFAADIEWFIVEMERNPWEV